MITITYEPIAFNEDNIDIKICTEIISLMNGILSVNEDCIKLIIKPSILKSLGSSSSSYEVNSPFSSMLSMAYIF